MKAALSLAGRAARIPLLDEVIHQHGFEMIDRSVGHHRLVETMAGCACRRSDRQQVCCARCRSATP